MTNNIISPAVTDIMDAGFMMSAGFAFPDIRLIRIRMTAIPAPATRCTSSAPTHQPRASATAKTLLRGGSSGRGLLEAPLPDPLFASSGRSISSGTIDDTMPSSLSVDSRGPGEWPSEVECSVKMPPAGESRVRHNVRCRETCVR